MPKQPIPAANLTAATAAGRALLAAGWRYDATSPMADDTTIRTLLHPSGREIHARTVDGGETTALTMTGLTLEQAAGAVLGAGLAPAAPVATRVVKARYLTPGQTVIREGVEPAIVAAAHREATGTVVVAFEGVTDEVYLCDPEEGVTVLAEATHQPTALPTILTFGAFNLPEARLSAYAKADDITDVIGDELSSAGYDLDTITMRFADGGRAVEVLDSNDEFVLGTVTISQPEPDHWLTLAEDLHRAAVRVATLAGSGLLKPASVNLNILVSVSPGDAERTVPVVDALAAAFGGTASPDEQTTYYHSARLQLGAVKFHPYTFVPDREESELERLRAEVAELRAAQGGA